MKALITLTLVGLAAAFVLHYGAGVGAKGPQVTHPFDLRKAMPAAFCRTVGKGVMTKPDRRGFCTPGAWIADADLSTDHVCSKGYNPRPPESVTGPLKRDGLKEYGLPESDGATTESDHLYPVWLGGATTESNLWPEPNYPPDQQTGYVHNPKDQLEFSIYVKTCESRSMTVARAREIFEAADWRREYRRYVGA